MGDPTAGGLTKDRDCPRGGECQGQNVENVYLAEGEPRKGHYEVVVHLEKLNGATAPIRVRLGVRMGPKSYGRVVELSRPAEDGPSPSICADCPGDDGGSARRSAELAPKPPGALPHRDRRHAGRPVDGGRGLTLKEHALRRVWRVAGARSNRRARPK